MIEPPEAGRVVVLFYPISNLPLSFLPKKTGLGLLYTPASGDTQLALPAHRISSGKHLGSVAGRPECLPALQRIQEVHHGRTRGGLAIRH